MKIMAEELKGVSERARTELTIIAVEAIGLVQGINAAPAQADAAKIARVLDKIEARVQEVRRELGGA